MFSPFLEKASKRGYDTIFLNDNYDGSYDDNNKKLNGIMCNNIPKYIKLLQKNSTDIME